MYKKHFNNEIKNHNNTTILLNEIKETLEMTQETLTEMNSKFDRATDERAPRTYDTSKHDTFILMKLNKPEYQWKYYVTRCQTNAVKKTIKKLLISFPQQQVLLEIKYQPNSKNLFNLIKENLATHIRVKSNYIKLLDTYTEKTFIQNICDLNDAKKDVDTDEEVPSVEEVSSDEESN